MDASGTRQYRGLVLGIHSAACVRCGNQPQFKSGVLAGGMSGLQTGVITVQSE